MPSATHPASPPTTGAESPAAAPATPTQGLTPQTIGITFLKQYYTVLHTEPRKLHMFYKKGSICIHGEENGEPQQPAVGQVEINAHLLPRPYLGSEIYVSQIDIQPCSNGILILVLADMQIPNDRIRRFVHTVFLAADSATSYHIQNDVFRFLKDPEPAAAASTAVHAETAPATTAAAAAADEPTPTAAQPATPEPAAAAAAVTPAPAPAVQPAPAAAPAPSAAPAPAARPQQPAPAVNAAVRPPAPQQHAAPAVEAPRPTTEAPRSYAAASAVRPPAATAAAAAAARPQATPAAAHAATATAPATPAAAAASAPATPSESASADSPAAHEGSRQRHSNSNTFVVENTVHVKSNATEEEIRQVYSRFGSIKTTKTGIGWCFVEFTGPEAAQRAINEPVVIGGKNVTATPKTVRATPNGTGPAPSRRFENRPTVSADGFQERPSRGDRPPRTDDGRRPFHGKSRAQSGVAQPSTA